MAKSAVFKDSLGSETIKNNILISVNGRNKKMLNVSEPVTVSCTLKSAIYNTGLQLAAISSI